MCLQEHFRFSTACPQDTLRFRTLPVRGNGRSGLNLSLTPPSGRITRSEVMQSGKTSPETCGSETWAPGLFKRALQSGLGQRDLVGLQVVVRTFRLAALGK